jgi:8-oxo-dGTP pyrophosphatase MutT (NUDIX family)
VTGGRRYTDIIRASQRFDASSHIPFCIAGHHIGWLRKAHAQRLMAWPDVFRRDNDGVHIKETLQTVDVRSGAVDAVIHALYAKGEISGWRNERYAVVTAFDAEPLMTVERAAARYFGITTYAAHANGYCGEGVDGVMWIARRAATKPIDPGKLDNLVGGGMCAGVAPLDTIVREAWEEAGIAADIARRAVATGTVRLLREVPEGVQSEVIFVHDLEVPRDFEPHNQDGEVAEFMCVKITALADMLNEGAEFTLDASLVIRMFLDRGRDIG